MARRRIPTATLIQLTILLVIVPSLVLWKTGWHSTLGLAIPLVTAAMWIGVITLAAWGAGVSLAHRALPQPDVLSERTFFAVMLGLGVLAFSTAVLAVLHLLRPSVVLIVLAGWASYGAIRFYRSLGTASGKGALELDPLMVPLVLAGGLSLAASTTFAPFFDQWNYQLAFPDQWLRAGTIISFDRHAYSFFPSNMGLLYVYALAGPGGWAAQVIHWMMGALTAIGAALLARRLGAPALGGLVAAAVFAASPGVVQMGALAGSDLGVAAFGIAAVLVLLGRAGDAPTTRGMLVSGVFAGVSVGCKYLALATVAVPLALAAVVMVIAAEGLRDRGRAAIRLLGVFAIAVAVTSGPWFLRNAVATGNPTHPYFASVFGQSSDVFEVSDRIGGFGWSSEKLEIALTLGTFHRGGHSGDLGPVFLALAPLALVWGWKHRRRTSVVAVFVVFFAGVLLWAVAPPLGRYLLPPLAVLSAAIGAGWAELVGGIGRVGRGLASVGLAVLLLANCNPQRSEYLPDQIACFVGAATTEDYVEANSTQIQGVQWINRELPEDARVVFVGESRVLGLERGVIVEDVFQRPLLVELADSSASVDEMGRQLDSLGATHLFINRAEGRRIAEAEGRPEYLVCGSDEARARLDQWLANHTCKIAGGGWWEVRVIEPGTSGY